MPDVGVRELKTQASEIVRQVRENRARYIITYRGQPVGLLMPLDEASSSSLPSGEEPAETPWEMLTRLGKEIGQGWQSPLSSTEMLSEMRR
jgi:prevent-host-death family protein